ncbi:ral guanine nucleotide dissociation stimulator-like [Canis lupus familiaris]|uniref:ral guanine nucleotide dissociation stimulator-like n=1 Tax=Canis lupus familiaris TaxID=9615 RepID=UPI0018F6C0BE|nr:ral guanine nucleotide dissociation stimulator-like [Canis lupus familiaris]
MFSCCRPTSGGSGSQEPQGCGLFLCCRQWLQHRYQGVRAVIRRRRQGAGAAAGKGHQIVLTKLTRTELLEYKVRQLLLALQRRDVIYIFSFLEDYRTFATTDEVLDLLFTEYGCIADAWGNNDVVLQCWKLAVSFMMEIWLNYYGDDFHQFPEFPSLIKLLELLRQHMPGTDAHLRALRHLRQFRRLHAGARGWAPTVGPAAPWGLAAGAEGLACDEPPAGEAKPLQIVVTAALQEPPAPLGALEEEQAPPPALEVVDVPQPPPN